MKIKGYRCDKCGKYLPRVWWSHISFRGFSDDCHLCKDCTRLMNGWICHKSESWNANLSEKEWDVLLPSCAINITENADGNYIVSGDQEACSLSRESMIAIYCYVRDGCGRFGKERRT